LILSEGGLVVSFIDKYHVLRTWSLEALLAPMDADIKAREKKRVESVLHKIAYAK
jgi:polo-like kinase 1